MNNVIVEKSKKFALRVIQLYQYLVHEKRKYVLSKQILRSGTSIGANVKEAIRGQSRADFFAKMNIALKETSETEYWLELLHESGYIDKHMFVSLYHDCKELVKILVAITKNKNPIPNFKFHTKSSI